MNGFSILIFHKPSFSDKYFKIILLYKKNSVPQALFLSQLQDLICNEQIQIILGDLNTDAFDSDNYASLLKSLERYSMVVWDPTRLSASLFDRLYVSNAILDKFQATATIRNIYFSNHDAQNVELRCIHYFFFQKNLFHVVPLIADQIFNKDTLFYSQLTYIYIYD